MEAMHGGSAHHGGVSAAEHPATSISELHHPGHGSYEGHVVPGVMFIIWAAFWVWSILRTICRHEHHLPSRGGGGAKHMHSTTSTSSSTTCAREQPFRSRAWYPWPFWPVPHLEPLAKVALPLLGVLIELNIGWGGWRPLYKADGHFAEFHANNWQHALMYAGFAVSGVVDLIGHVTPLPAGTEQGFLALAFVVETLLMGLHTKHNALDALVHRLLTWVMVACVAACAAEIAAPRSLLLALLRAMLVLLQGTWFWHIGAIMFKDSMAWDMHDMGGTMFVPVVFCLHLLLITLGVFTVYLFMRFAYARFGVTAGSSSSYHALPLCHSFTTTGTDDGSKQRQHQYAPACHEFDSLETALELVDYPTATNGDGGSSLDAVSSHARDVAARHQGVHGK